MCDGGYTPWDGSSYIAMVGLDGVGKTSLCLQALGSDANPRPTGMEDCMKTNTMSPMRLNEWSLLVRKTYVQILDLGGQPQHYVAWPKRYANVLCMMIVIDASSLARWGEFVFVYKKVIQSHLLSARIPAVFVLNKQDRVVSGTAAVTPEILKEALGLEDPITRPDHFDICKCSAFMQESVRHAFSVAVQLLAECKRMNNTAIRREIKVGE